MRLPLPRFFKLAARFLCGALLMLVNQCGFAAQPIKVASLHYGEIVYDYYNQDYFTALVRTMIELQLHDDPQQMIPERLSPHADDARLLQGGLHLAYGQYRHAEQIFKAVLASRPDDALLRNRAWYFIGKLAYERGHYQDAVDALQHVDAEQASDLRADSDLLFAQVLLQTGQPAAAAARLAAWRGPDSLRPYVDYNRGLALLQSGAVNEALPILDALARLDIPEGEIYALKDKTNLGMGYHFLRADQAASAADWLRRVRLQGPFSNRALLGLGWSAADQHDFQQALLPWQTLSQRSVFDFAVLEAKLAVPYAQAELGLHGQATQSYQAALSAYDLEASRLGQAMFAAEQGQLIDELLQQTRDYEQHDAAASQSAVSAHTDNARYFIVLLAGYEFRRGLQHYRQLQQLSANLTGWQKNAQAFDDMLNTRQQRYAQQLPRVNALYQSMDLDGLQARRQHLAEQLQNDLNTGDELAVAPASQQLLQAKLDTLMQAANGLESDQERRAALDKLRILRGVLVWDLSEHYPQRAWQLRKHLRQTDQALTNTQVLLEKLAAARVQVPGSFQGYAERIVTLKTRIAALQTKTAQISARQHQYLQQLAVTHLQTFQQRLQAYRLQAQFGLAQNYDRVANQPAANQPIDVAPAPNPADVLP